MPNDPVPQLIETLLEKSMAPVRKELEANPTLLKNPRIGEVMAVAITMWGDRAYQFTSFLLDRGVSPNVTCGGIPLIEVAVRQCAGPKVVRLLLERGADLKGLEKGGRMLLLRAICGGRPKAIINDLLQFGVKKDLIVRLTLEGPKKVLADLKKNPSLLRELDDPVEFLNHSLAHEELAELLLKLGVDPNGHGPAQDAPLRLAARAGYVNVVRLLLDHGADPNPKDAKAGKPVIWYDVLDLALVEPVLAISELLVERGAKTIPKHDEWVKGLQESIPRRGRGKKK